MIISRSWWLQSGFILKKPKEIINYGFGIHIKNIKMCDGSNLRKFLFIFLRFLGFATALWPLGMSLTWVIIFKSTSFLLFFSKICFSGWLIGSWPMANVQKLLILFGLWYFKTMDILIGYILYLLRLIWCEIDFLKGNSESSKSPTCSLNSVISLVRENFKLFKFSFFKISFWDFEIWLSRTDSTAKVFINFLNITSL